MLLNVFSRTADANFKGLDFKSHKDPPDIL